MSAVLAVFAAVLTGGCGGGPGGAGTGPPDHGKASPTQARPAITPADSIVPPTGSGDLPKAVAEVCQKCQKRMNDGGYRSLIDGMGEVASAPDSTDSEKVIARACMAAAYASTGEFIPALHNVDAAKAHLADIPPEVRPQLLELIYHTEVVSAAALGERDRARKALARLERLGHQPGDYVRDACVVAPDPAAVPECTTATPSVTVTESPSDDSKRPETPQPDTPTDGATEPPEDRNPVSPDGDDDEPAPKDS